jgi:myo-inositol 2-dehydrogenase/D-chiro-inositol 1-dehydrogenase
MPPIALNRRRFLGCSAAAGLAFSQSSLADTASELGPIEPVRLGLIGVGNRGTTLLRSLLEIPAATVVAVCDVEPKHRARGMGIVEKARGERPAEDAEPRQLLERPDIDAVVVALPCDLHETVYLEVLRAGKHLYAEKPLAITLEACDRLIAEAEKFPALALHVGYQRRSHPRYREGVDLLRGGELGQLLEARASWNSSNGPLLGHRGWLGRRARSGDFMVEHAVHLWDVLHWVRGEPPKRASGWGKRGLFAHLDPERDVTDHYAVELEWADGFRASLIQSWVAPASDEFTGSTLQFLGAAGGLDLSTGTMVFRDRQRPRRSLHPGPQNDTRLALESFLRAVHDHQPSTPPVSLAEARAATLTGLLAREAVDRQAQVTLEEILQTHSG